MNKTIKPLIQNIAKYLQYSTMKFKLSIFCVNVLLMFAACKNYVEPSPVQGTFKDARDGKEYGFVILKDGKSG